MPNYRKIRNQCESIHVDWDSIWLPQVKIILISPCFDPYNFCFLGYDVKDGRNQLIGRMTRNFLHCVPSCYRLDIQSQVEPREFIVKRDCSICFLLPYLCGARWYVEDNSGSSIGEIRHKVCQLKTCCIPYYELNFTSSLSSTDKMLIMSSVMIVEWIIEYAILIFK